jgi:hypothetical protein
MILQFIIQCFKVYWEKKKKSSYAYETLVTQILINVVVNNSNNISFTVKLWLIYLQEKVS